MAWLRLFAGSSLEPLSKRLSAKNYQISRARRAARRGDWSAAARRYEKSLRAYPDAAPLWVQYGHALKEEADLRGAEKAYRIALQLMPAPDTLVHLGHVLLRTSRSREAAQAFFRALTINSDFVPAREGLIAADVAADEISSMIERGTLQAPAEDSDVQSGAPAEPQQFEAPNASVRRPRLAQTPVRHQRGLESAVAERLAGCREEYPSFSIVAVDQRRVAGWAFLPFDFHHTPLVNVYYGGRLVACALANRTRPVELTSGPEYNWFEILWSEWSLTPDRSQLARLLLQRGEDGAVCRSAEDGRGRANSEIDRLVEAELFDEGAPALATSRLHRLPATAIVELYYLDYLGRAADDGSLGRYVNALRRNAITIDDFRCELLWSAEFRRRQIRPHHRLGRIAMIQSLSLYEQVPFERRPPLKRYEEISAGEFMSGDHSRFVQTCYSRILLRSADRRARRDLVLLLDEKRVSRLDVLRGCVLRAAANGRLVQIQNLPQLRDWNRRTGSPSCTEGAVL
jgi:tetratricopeptide (TPR) repeat protein